MKTSIDYSEAFHTPAAGEFRSRPILFTGAMVCAILDGRKTQTRRLVKPQPTGIVATKPNFDGAFSETTDPVTRYFACPYGKPGDQLWVKETFRLWDHDFETVEVQYEADNGSKYVEGFSYTTKPKRLHERGRDGHKLKRPSIFMPRWASRITLEITEVRVERVQDISEEDCQAEGVEHDGLVGYYCEEDLNDEFGGTHRCNWRSGYAALWDSINAKKSPWYSNPWVWVITFKKL